MNGDSFSHKLLAWWDRHGRKDLPWQRERTPYRVWVSEIMLQQTQVATVIPYYQRFMQRFPDVQTLADAPLDEVLHHWSGLGYYARARHLLRTAQHVVSHHDSEFPRDQITLMQLPGIGRSTAAAILALAADQPLTILDGNVKRVLSRYHAIAGWPGQREVEQTLWALAEQHTPTQRVADYTQAIMDLGATLCTRAKPLCVQCPLRNECSARRENRTGDFPAPKPRKTLPVRSTRMLLLRNETQDILLMQRPPTGVWGGLWSLPECAADTDPQHWCREHLHCDVAIETAWPTLRHTFSHFHLDIEPLPLRLVRPRGVMEGATTLWYNPRAPQALGLAAPVARLLDKIKMTGEPA